jgi:hypothetical protein
MNARRFAQLDAAGRGDSCRLAQTLSMREWSALRARQQSWQLPHAFSKLACLPCGWSQRVLTAVQAAARRCIPSSC